VCSTIYFSCFEETRPGSSGRALTCSASMPAALRPQDISDHFAELAAALDNDPSAIYDGYRVAGLRPGRQKGSDGWWAAPPKIRFAIDSPLEGAGFEPSVPHRSDPVF
jgi:hypothetical protein